MPLEAMTIGAIKAHAREGARMRMMIALDRAKAGSAVLWLGSSSQACQTLPASETVAIVTATSMIIGQSVSPMPRSLKTAMRVR